MCMNVDSRTHNEEYAKLPETFKAWKVLSIVKFYRGYEFFGPFRAGYEYREGVNRADGKIAGDWAKRPPTKKTGFRSLGRGMLHCYREKDYAVRMAKRYHHSLGKELIPENLAVVEVEIKRRNVKAVTLTQVGASMLRIKTGALSKALKSAKSRYARHNAKRRRGW